MDVRDSANPVLAGARRWLARASARHPWGHNEHFHGWILRNLPARRWAAVDAGRSQAVPIYSSARCAQREPEPVRVVAYDPGWPERFEAWRERLAGLLGATACRIEHLGST